MFLREGSGRSVASHQDSSISGGLCLVLSQHWSPVLVAGICAPPAGGGALVPGMAPPLTCTAIALTVPSSGTGQAPRGCLECGRAYFEVSALHTLGEWETSDHRGRSTMVLPGPIQYVMFNKVKCNDDCMEPRWPPRRACQALLKTFRRRWEKRRRKGRHSFNSVQHTPCDGCTQ